MKKLLNTTKGVIRIDMAQECHVEAISGLTKGENLLFRSPEEVRKMLPCYLVALNDLSEVVGCVSAKWYGYHAEIVSFRVVDQYQHVGIGDALLQNEIQLLQRMPFVERIFALSTNHVAESCFAPLGFIEVGIQLFGWKVLLECSKCPKNIIGNDGKHQCNEIALLFHPR